MPKGKERGQMRRSMADEKKLDGTFASRGVTDVKCIQQWAEKWGRGKETTHGSVASQDVIELNAPSRNLTGI